jgi:putative transposase
VADVHVWIRELGQLHGRTAFQWNGQDNRRGRKVWHRCAETTMKSERHFQATLLYVLHNPVRHRYVNRWQEWPFGNAQEWLVETGEAQARRLWKEFPLGNYGDDWDPPEM